MKRWSRLVAAGLVGAGVPAALMVVGVMACGPDFEPEVFVPANHPDAPARYAEGHLGILQPGYYHAELVVAYRYLAGGRLSEAEKAVYVPPQSHDTGGYEKRSGPMANESWQIARTGFAMLSPVLSAEPVAQDRIVETQRTGYVERSSELNCPDAAFTTATATLAQRAKAWGLNSPELAEWMRGQDAVFSNCEKPGSMPAAAQAGWSAGLKRDREYQIAAAKFYAADYDGAVQDFVSIGKDKASPWSRWGEYLAARAEVRKAASTTKAADYGQLANFDKEGMKAAQTRLSNLQKETKDGEILHAAAAELEFIQVRLEPVKRLDSAGVALAGPGPDAAFERDLTDLDFLMDHHVTGDSDLTRWITGMQSGGALADAKAATPTWTVLSQWRERRTTPWLVAALARTHVSDADGAELMAAAAKVPRDSPAYADVNADRIGLLLTAGTKADARTLADSMLAAAGPEISPATRNAFLGERMRTARNLSEFLADAPRTMIESESSPASMAGCTSYAIGQACGKTIPPLQFDQDSADSFNKRMPMAVWEEAAHSSALPANLHDGVAWAAWMRAVALGNDAAAKQMSALLPAAVKKTAGESDGFPATLAILRNPGLRPYLDQGVQRSVSYDRWTRFAITGAGAVDGAMARSQQTGR